MNAWRHRYTNDVLTQISTLIKISSDMFVLILGGSDAVHLRGHLDRNTDMRHSLYEIYGSSGADSE